MISFNLTLQEACLAFDIEFDVDDLVEQAYAQQSSININDDNFAIPYKYHGLIQTNPELVEQCACDAMSMSIEDDYRSAQEQAVISGIDAIDGTVCSYLGENEAGEPVSVNKTSRFEYTLNSQDDEGRFTIEAENLHHFANAMVDGGGYCAADLPTDVEIDDADEAKKLFIAHASDYFEIYGDRKPKIDMSRLSLGNSYMKHFTRLLEKRTAT